MLTSQPKQCTHRALARKFETLQKFLFTIPNFLLSKNIVYGI